MANDATNKTAPNSDSYETSSLATASDQQKVPPLRIVLNSTSNQKAASTTVAGQQASSKKEKSQDARGDGSIKGGGRVRIKLGTNKQQQAGKASETAETATNKRTSESTGARGREKASAQLNDKQEENINEDSSSNFGHLRRITRRSQRTIQSISNEDEESISSMTSVDENLNTNASQPNSDTTQDPEQSNPAASTAGSASTSNNAANGSSSTDTPRRYKRRKLESSESQSFECDSLLGSQNYKLPHQNSFELFKNIRKQVDKRLKSLSCIQPRTPSGLRDYMLTRGAYLLDGNKLGNGTSLYMNEDGGLNTEPLGKYHVFGTSRTQYSVPDKARVPASIAIDSPLHDLFVEQEKERHRMRIQHIKEREKLTLAAEQEFVRAHGQAALVAANQDEPFSVCTMLKHQEIYNYLDSNGATILSREDAQQDQVNQPDGVRTRRRQQGHISPAPVRRPSGVDESAAEAAKKDTENSNPPPGDKKSETGAATANEKGSEEPTDSDNKIKTQDGKSGDGSKGQDKSAGAATDGVSGPAKAGQGDRTKGPGRNGAEVESKSETDDSAVVKTDPEEAAQAGKEQQEENGKQSADGEAEHAQGASKSGASDSKDASAEPGNSASKMDTSPVAADEQSESASQPMSVDSVAVVSDEERRAANRETFLAQLQEIDDKWDKIRREMLVRHRNEAESLHAIQKLEWEWKTKETEVCDVRSTLVIDNTLVPKLDVLSQDY